MIFYLSVATSGSCESELSLNFYIIDQPYIHYSEQLNGLPWKYNVASGLQQEELIRDISLKVMMYSVDVQANHFMSAAKGACPKFGLKS